LDLGANGAKCNSLGHRPRWNPLKRFLALKARNDDGLSEVDNVFNRDLLSRAFSASRIVLSFPRALPWAITFRAFGAEAGCFYIAPLAYALVIAGED